MFKTGELASLLGVERSLLHYYDRAGIIQPSKDENKFRYYNENDLIALASSRYYRAMGMNLDALREIIHTSGLEEKMSEMDEIQKQISSKIDFLKDCYEVTEYAKQTYYYAYHNDLLIVEGEASSYFVPMVENGEMIKKTIMDEKVQNLLQQFPFVAYAYYFPKRSLSEQEHFRYQLGLACIPKFINKREIEMPETYVRTLAQRYILFNLVKDMDSDRFYYEDFASLHDFVKEKHLQLSGEAIAYCVFSNYGFEKGKIRFVFQCFLP